MTKNKKDLQFLNDLLENEKLLKNIVLEFFREYFIYKPECVNSYEIFQQVLKRKIAYIKSQNNPNFEILSFYKTKSDKIIFKKKNFWGKEKELITYENKIEIIDKNSDEFNNLFYVITEFKIYSILRKSDNTILTVNDQTTYHNSFEPTYFEPIGGFCLDGDNYWGHELKSESGIQVFFGGGTFVDIKDIKLK